MRDDIPENERYSIAVFEASNTKNTGTNIVKKEKYDLMTLIVIKLGEKVYNGKRKTKDMNFCVS